MAMANFTDRAVSQVLTNLKLSTFASKLAAVGDQGQTESTLACGSPTGLHNESRTRVNSIFPARRRG
jgi:hypothetical protein